MGAMNPITEQEFYRIRSDTTGADPGTPSWASTENQATRTNVDVTSGDQTRRIRFTIANTGTAAENGQFELYVNKNSTSYARVETSGTVGVLLSSAASSSADQTALTTANFQLTAGTGTAVDGAYDDGVTDVGVGTNLSNGDNFELEFGLNFVAADLADGDTFDFRVYVGGAALDTYDANATAIMDITKPAPSGHPRAFDHLAMMGH
jgi:hypothetical protein